MTLREYLYLYNITAREFAQFIDYTPQYICDIKRGVVIPSKKLARLIEEATGSKVEASQYDEKRRIRKGPKKRYPIVLKTKKEEKGLFGAITAISDLPDSIKKSAEESVKKLLKEVDDL